MDLRTRRIRSTELITKLYRLRNEDYRKTFDDWFSWWNLSGMKYIGVMPHTSPFGFVLRTGNIDLSIVTLEPKDLTNKDDPSKGYDSRDIDDMINSIKETLAFVEKKKTETIRFASIPVSVGTRIGAELIAVAKTSSGTSYVFSHDLEFLKYLKLRGL